MVRPRLVLASRNAHKITELQRMAAWVDWVAMPLELGDPPETGATFEANALQKARYVFEQTGSWALADDSGIAVDALGGRPGVHSKRYSPEGTDHANNRLLLTELAGATTRKARYHCVIALVGPAGAFTHPASPAGAFTHAATCEGQIGFESRGSGGFGYDPLFWPDETPERTMAELSPAEKDQISHRGRAMRFLPTLLEQAGLRRD